MTPRIAPVAPPYDAGVADELARWMPPGSPVDPLALFRTLVRDRPLAEAMLPLGRFLLGRGLGLPKRVRELVIDRVCARCGCEYEWGVHAVAFGAAAGLGDAELTATARGRANDPAFTPDDAAVIRLVDELHDTGHVSDALWTDLARRWSPEQLLELLVLAGWYHVISYVANGARVALEPWAARFPPSTA
ncbi:MAG TPA: carboxymuconolactone decarboxylase family protein [Candidatus Eisenbacteria bacterium]|nr:carboxymuconolactone decarboxylase family protein [Candidatus Eisenbacteria bacterium]